MSRHGPSFKNFVRPNPADKMDVTNVTIKSGFSNTKYLYLDSDPDIGLGSKMIKLMRSKTCGTASTKGSAKYQIRKIIVSSKIQL